MSRVLARCVFTCSVGVWLAIALAAPWVLDDTNGFTAKFVGTDLLSVVGVVISITLASATNINFELNKIVPASAATDPFKRTRAAIRNSAIGLIISWIAALVIVVLKPLVAHSATSTALTNGLGLLIVLFDALVLIDLTQTALAIVQPPKP